MSEDKCQPGWLDGVCKDAIATKEKIDWAMGRGTFNPKWIEPKTEERNPFECWVNRYAASMHYFETKDAADSCECAHRIGPALHMIEATPLTLAAGEMLAMLERLVRPSVDPHRYDEARALICRARGEPS